MIKIRGIAVAIALVCGGGVMLAPPPASAQWAVFDPTNYIQNFMTQLRAVQSNANEAMQLARQLDQLRYMAQNTEALAGGNWDLSLESIDRLGSLLESGQSLAVSAGDFDRLFRQQYPDYDPGANYGDQYNQWLNGSRDSILGAMRVANMQVQGVNDERQAMTALRQAARSTTGQKAALDAANQIALAQVDQMQKLRGLMIAQQQATGSYMAAVGQTDATRRAAEREATRAPQLQRASGKRLCAVPPC